MAIRTPRIYLDVSCLNRPFDDNRQDRIRLEAEAVSIILEQCDEGLIVQLASQISELEIAGTRDAERRRRVLALLPPIRERLRLTAAIFARGGELEALGVEPADSLHLAAAESLRADAFLTCDDRLIRGASRHRDRILMPVLNPVEWLSERYHAPNA